MAIRLKGDPQVIQQRLFGLPKKRSDVLGNTSEQALLNQCLQLAIWKGCLAWRNNVGAVEGTDTAGKRRFVRFGQKGHSDLFGVLPDGRFLAVETKLAKNRPTDEQEAFLRSVLKQGGIAYWVTSLKEHEWILDRVMVHGDRIALDADGEVVLTDAAGKSFRPRGRV